MAIRERNYIGGEWRTGAESLAVFNPAACADVVGWIVRSDASDVEAAIERADDAHRKWALKGFTERSNLISAALGGLAKTTNLSAQLYVRENGKTLAEAMPEVMRSPLLQIAACALAADFGAGEGARSRLDYLPFGVVVVIPPWNSPVAIALQNLIPALLAGNCVVLKPPESCPLALIKICGDLATQLPPGVLNIVTGLPEDIGAALTQDPRVAKIVFTGSGASACAIARGAANRVRSMAFELGGNDAALILPDAKIDDLLASKIARAAFRMAGQVCMAIKRVYVPADRMAELVEHLARQVDGMIVGDGLAPETVMGPVHSAAAKARAGAFLQDAIQSGGQPMTLGRFNNEIQEGAGHFVLPSLVVDPHPDSRLVVEEQFCPVLPLVSYTDLEMAITQINGTDFGLGASVWGSDLAIAEAVARRLEAGVVFINGHGIQSLDRTAPFGGIKQSGLGRAGGREGLLEFLQPRAITFCGP